jgi:hypothetical protein
MTMGHRFLLVAILPALLISAQAARAQAAWSWDGTWTGMLGKTHLWPMSVVITEGKVVSYTLKGTPFDVQYSKIGSTTFSFGDRDNYSVKLTKTGGTTASARVHGRIGYGTASLTKQ